MPSLGRSSQLEIDRAANNGVDPKPAPFYRGTLWPTILSVVAFIVLWTDLVRQLSYNWSSNEQYAYGWFVPFLSLGLFLKKWSTRPTPATPGRWPRRSWTLGLLSA